jgi:hypothetical protein
LWERAQSERGLTLYKPRSPPETVANLKTERVASPEDFAAAWSKFERTVLPLLIKYEILAPVPVTIPLTGRG